MEILRNPIIHNNHEFNFHIASFLGFNKLSLKDYSLPLVSLKSLAFISGSRVTSHYPIDPASHHTSS
jgi:hypothetical protein